MTKVKQEIDRKDYYKEIHFLYEILNSLKGLDEVKSFFKDMLTKSELIMLKRRWHIATLLFKGGDIRSVAIETQTSTNTVARVKRVLEEGYGGLISALEKAKQKEKQEKEKFLSSQRPKKGSKFVKGWFH